MSLSDNQLSRKIHTITKYLETTLIFMLQYVIYSAGQLHECIDTLYSSDTSGVQCELCGTAWFCATVPKPVAEP
jgi:hypothetical protein